MTVCILSHTPFNHCPWSLQQVGAALLTSFHGFAACDALEPLQFCAKLHYLSRIAVQVTPHTESIKFNGAASIVTLPPFSLSVVALDLGKSTATISES